MIGVWMTPYKNGQCELSVSRDGIDKIVITTQTPLTDAQAEELFWCIGAMQRSGKTLKDLLQEQEARVMTLDQLEDALDTVVWLETPVSENLADGYSLIMACSHKYGYMFFDSPFGDNPSQDRLEYSEYGKSWRCWNKRPTDEQRQAVKWE